MNLNCRKILVVLSVVTNVSVSYTQIQPDKVHQDTTRTGQDRHSLFSAAGYGSNMIYLGTTISQNNPYLSASLTYGFHDALYLNASAVHLNGLTPWLSLTSASATYLHTFNSWFDFSADISGYRTSESLKDTLFSDFLYTSATVGIDWRLLYTRITGGAFVYGYNQWYIQAVNSRYFQTPEFFRGKAYISFEPGISILFGPTVRSDTITENIGPDNFHVFKKPKQVKTKTTIIYSEKFGLIDLEFVFPVSLNFGRMTLEAEPTYLLVPVKDNGYDSMEGFYFYLSLYYRIF